MGERFQEHQARYSSVKHLHDTVNRWNNLPDCGSDKLLVHPLRNQSLSVLWNHSHGCTSAEHGAGVEFILDHLCWSSGLYLLRGALCLRDWAWVPPSSLDLHRHCNDRRRLFRFHGFKSWVQGGFDRLHSLLCHPHDQLPCLHCVDELRSLSFARAVRGEVLRSNALLSQELLRVIWMCEEILVKHHWSQPSSVLKTAGGCYLGAECWHSHWWIERVLWLFEQQLLHCYDRLCEG